MKKIFQNKIVQFVLILIVIIFLFSVIFPNTRTAGFFRSVYSAVFNPIQSTFYSFSKGAQSTFTSYTEIGQIRSERNRLAQKVRELTEENSYLKELEYENEVLREQLKLSKKKPELNLVAGEITARGVNGFTDEVVINKGRKDGVKKDQPVVSGQFLVGRIKKTTNYSSYVEFITSYNSVVNGMLQNSRAPGLVKGGLGYELTMESIPKNVEIKEGERVITSGLGGGYPKGLIIGEVEEVLSGQGDIFKKASLITPINFSQTEILFVVK